MSNRPLRRGIPDNPGAMRRLVSTGRQVRLHDLLAEPGVLILRHRDADLLEQRDFGPCVRFHRLDNRAGRGLMVVRPDGYVGFRRGVADVTQLCVWLARVGVMM